MKCGHTSNATTEVDGVRIQCCAICSGLTPNALIIEDQPIDLTGRQAKCPDCGKLEPSSLDLAFFKHRGPGSAHSKEFCIKCGSHKTTHNKDHWAYKEGNCLDFEPGATMEYDSYYSGCKGWS